MSNVTIIPPWARRKHSALNLFGVALLAAAIGLAGAGVLRGSPAQAATTATVQVGQANLGTTVADEYNAASVTISLGDTVSFTLSAGNHNVISAVVPAGASAFGSAGTATDPFAKMTSGVPYPFTPTVAGTYTYYCGLHAYASDAGLANVDANIAGTGPNGKAMVGKIVVTGSAPTATPTAPAATATPTATPPAGATPTPTSAPPTATPTTPTGAQVDVQALDNSFSPADITVAPGTTVRWVNNSTKPHTVTSITPAPGWDSGNVAKNTTYSHTFSTAGVYSYYCDYHLPGMIGSVTVTGGTSTPTTTATTTATATATTTATATPTPPPPAAPGSVNIIDNDYSPKDLAVAVGASVRFVNVGARKHTVTATDLSFDSGLMVTGDVYSRTFGTAGTYPYYCDLHPGMIGTVTVGTGGGSAGTTPTPTPTPATPPPPAAPGAVNIIDYDYSPKDLSVAPGASVRFVNVGVKKHTVTANDFSFDSGLMATGDVYSRTFSLVGTYPYFCDLHPDMVGSITVTDSAGAATSWPALPGVPSSLLYNEVYNLKTGTYSVEIVASLADIRSGNSALWSVILQGVRAGTITAADVPPNIVSFIESQYSRLGGPPASFRAAAPTATPTKPASAPTATRPAAAPVAAGEVQAIDFDYNPRTITVQPGTSIRFVNTGKARHTVTAIDGSFDSGLMAKGDAYTRTFSTPGTYDYLCVLHPEMIGTVQVADEAGAVPPPAPAPAPLPAPVVSLGNVQIVDFLYSPRSITVKPGASLRFVNADTAPHTVTAVDGSFDSGFMAKGVAYSRTFATPGTYDYFCEFHPEMTGSVRVVDATGVAPPPAATTGASSPKPGVSLPAGRSAASVTMIDSDYEPRTMTVKPGTEVSWQNVGVAPHTATARDGSFDSGLVKRGGSYAYRFDAAGTFTYYCTLHPKMEGTIVVSESNELPAAGVRLAVPPVPAVEALDGTTTNNARNILIVVWGVVALVGLVAVPTAIYGYRSSRNQGGRQQ